VYANSGLEAVTDNDLKQLGQQLADLNREGRDVFLRFCPEMNGNWFPYGYQPTLFKSTWIRMATTVRKLAPKVALVWAPNYSSGYPFGRVGPPAPKELLPEDLELLDTNKDGKVGWEDDPFTAYFPGSEHVDCKL
jgi:beta-mannanase